MKVGDRVRVKTPLNVFHHPEHKGKAFDITGLEGEIVRIHTEWHGRPISPNYPYEVRFTPKFVTHLGDHEIESAN
ncbi:MULTISPECIES: ferredoxin-thioredoxin reductase variable chain [Pseudanabaena]|uniref:Ferredoxin thioredoxin reductase alpha chain n=2 Tax=Pseudanabaena TaxID=1152 RepID=L8MXN4_9CYAN|nr:MULTISPECIES: ferredoxin-thioredoxin reductase variable chain [Pseudanabaena]ELS30743.1 ferredoxin thioredoxin reductase alpha chain [Pseudanabaena biceps PCC 7429]MDG3496984.1 ferredoxin-thioredoxin reductase variable chain [Pseudanabaena catenata USMAC16]TYQ26610.1 ferredoxin--nitrite reductase [Pseudanabaena sp. UWO310]